MQGKKKLDGIHGELKLSKKKRKEISGRDNWQGTSLARGMGAEYVFKTFFEGKFRRTSFEIIHHPMNFKKLYAEDHGIQPDFLFRNKKNGKQFFVEIKRQHAGRGNAHERACRYFTPGLIQALKTECNINEITPIWLVFCNGITKDKKRVREIKFWFDNHELNYLLWEHIGDTSMIEKHFDKHIKAFLK